eukprot:jgi/Mesvir1/20279/Mv08582-RA.1
MRSLARCLDGAQMSGLPRRLSTIKWKFWVGVGGFLTIAAFAFVHLFDRPRYALQSSTGLHRPAQLPSLDGLIYSGRVVGHDGRMVKRVHTPAASPTGGTALGDPSTLPDWHKNVLSACSLHPASPAKDPAKEDPPASADSGGPDKSLKPPLPPKDLRSWEDLGRIATEWWSGRSAPRKIPLSNTCQDALSWSQEAYFMLSDGTRAEFSQQHWHTAEEAIGQICLFVDVGGSMLPFLSSLHLHHRNGSRIGTQCGIVAYEPSRSGFSTLQKAAIKANAWRKRAGLGSMGPGPTGLGLVDVTTFDVEMEHAMGTQIVSGNAPIRLPAWTIVRVAAAGMEWEVLRGMQATLMVKGIAALAWNWSPRFSSSWVPGVLKAQAEFLASFGYAVYIVGINVSLRIDGPHWCPDPGADKQGCLMRHSMTLLAVVADPNSSLFRFMESRLLCRLVEPPPPASSPLPPSTTPPPTTTSLVPVVAATAATTTTAATPAVTGTGFVPGQRRMLLADDATPAVALAPGSNEAGPSQGEEQGQTQGQGQGQGQSQGRTQAERQADRHGASQAEASQALAVVVAAEPPRPDPLALVPSSSPPPAGVPEGSQCFCWRPKDATQLLAAEDTLHPKGGRGQKKKVFRGLGSGMVVGAWEELEVPQHVVCFHHHRTRGGWRAFTRGWLPTLLGYSLQGALKFGLYERFKKIYLDAWPFGDVGVTALYLISSASAEFFADFALCPFEAVKVRLQTVPSFQSGGMVAAFRRVLLAEGFGGLYRGLLPLWGRQIPYTMMKFASFERTVEFLYRAVLRRPAHACSPAGQLAVSLAGRFSAGVLCSVVSQPADLLVSRMNNHRKGTGGADQGFWQAVRETGLLHLATRGLPTRVLMVGTLCALQWLLYDAFKLMVGLPTTGH